MVTHFPQVRRCMAERVATESPRTWGPDPLSAIARTQGPRPLERMGAFSIRGQEDATPTGAQPLEQHRSSSPRACPA